MPSLSRRALIAGAAVVASPAILHWPADAAEFSFKYGTDLPLEHPLNVRSTEAAAKVKEESGGQLEIAVFGNNVLGGDTAMLPQAISGALQMYALSGDILAPKVPSAGITGTGFAFANYDQVWAALDGDLGVFQRGVIEKIGLHPMERIWDHGFRQITTRSKPIVVPADLHNLKIRVPVAPTLIALFKHLGVAVTAINFGEVYSALQTGIVDGQENPLVLIDVAKLYEVQKYCSITNHVWAGYYPTVNVAAWNKLGPKLQEILARNFNETAIIERADLVRLNQSVRESLKTRGLVFNDVDTKPFREALQKSGFYSEAKQRMGDQAWAVLEKYVGTLA